MAEHTAYPGKSASLTTVAASSFPNEHVAAPVVYRRLSGFAIASLAVGGLYLLILIISTAWALRDQTPVDLPVYMQAVPILGIALALVSMFFISHSDGTLGGRKLASWGLGTCLVASLGYWAYYTALDFAISDQAEVFTRAWFKKIIDGEVGAAFLDTQDPAARQNINPRDEKTINLRFLMALPAGADGVQRGPLIALREKDIISVLRQGGDKSHITTKGVREWGFKAGGYRVRQMFVISTEDGDFETQVTVHGVESPTREFEGRRWYVVYSESAVIGKRPSAVADEVHELAQDAAPFVKNWFLKLQTGWVGLAYSDIQAAEMRSKQDTAFATQMLVYGLSATPGASLFLVNHEAAAEWHRAEFSALLRKNLTIKQDRFDADDEGNKAAVLAGLNRLLGGREPGPGFFGTGDVKGSLVNPWRYQNGRVLVPLDTKLGFFSYTTNGQYEVQADVTVESDPVPLDGARHKNQLENRKYRVAGRQGPKPSERSRPRHAADAAWDEARRPGSQIRAQAAAAIEFQSMPSSRCPSFSFLVFR